MHVTVITVRRVGHGEKEERLCPAVFKPRGLIVEPPQVHARDRSGPAKGGCVVIFLNTSLRSNDFKAVTYEHEEHTT